MPSRNRLVSCGCAFLMLIAFALIHPQAEIGINDDWSFLFTAKRLAETGHIVYNGWSAAILGVQLYWGALFIRLFGFSFFAARASTMCVAVLSSFVSYDLITRCGIRSWNAAFGTLALTLSPIFLGVATTFMTDTNGMFFILLYFYACVRCELARSRQAALTWIVIAALAGLAGGSIRQIVFLCNLVALPGLLWHLRRRFSLLLLGVALWVSSAIVTFWMLHWFKHQPYVAVEALYTLPHNRIELGALRQVMEKSMGSFLLLVSPVLFLIALRFPILGWKRIGSAMLVILSIALIVTFFSNIHHGGEWWTNWLLGNYVTVYARAPQWFMLGPEAPLIGWGGVFTYVVVFVLGVTFFAAATLWHFRRKPQAVAFSDVDAALLWTAMPFIAAYLVLVFTRATIYDRYFLPILFLAILFALRWLERHEAAGVPGQAFSRVGIPLAVVPLALLSLYGVANSHDMFATSRARLAAIDELRARGVSRDQIRDGFEFDGWTEIELAGFVNEPRMEPAGALLPYRYPKALDTLQAPSWKPCHSFFFTYAPAIHAHYVLQNVRDYCFATTSDAPVPYTTWLPPHDNTVYIGDVPEQFR